MQSELDNEWNEVVLTNKILGIFNPTFQSLVNLKSVVVKWLSYSAYS